LRGRTYLTRRWGGRCGKKGKGRKRTKITVVDRFWKVPRHGADVNPVYVARSKEGRQGLERSVRRKKKGGEGGAREAGERPRVNDVLKR